MYISRSHIWLWYIIPKFVETVKLIFHYLHIIPENEIQVFNRDPYSTVSGPTCIPLQKGKNPTKIVAQSAGATEYTDCNSAEG